MQKLLTYLLALAMAGSILLLSFLLVAAQSWVYEAYLPQLANPGNLTEEEMQGNYQSLLRFILLPGRTNQAPALEGLASSPEADQHFREVRAIFQGAYLWILLSLVAFCSVLWRYSQLLPHILRYAALLNLSFLGLLALFMSLDFNCTFIIFHKLFFANDYWQFNPQTDPIILYLPQRLFRSLAFAAVLLCLLLDGLSFYFAKHLAAQSA